MPEYELAKAVLMMALHDLNNPDYKADKDEIRQFLVEARRQEVISHPSTKRCDHERVN